MTRSAPCHPALSEARSLLFVPGNRPEPYQKALASGADAVVLDLEDSVPATEKQAARDAIGRCWNELLAAGLLLVIRVNAPQSAPGADDLAWIESIAAPAALMVAKAESRSSLEGVAARLPGSAPLPLGSSRQLRAMLCIQPRQVAVVHAAMAPGADEIAWARRVVAADAASGGAAVQLDGRMVDAPVVLQARRVLARMRGSERA